MATFLPERMALSTSSWKVISSPSACRVLKLSPETLIADETGSCDEGGVSQSTPSERQLSKSKGESKDVNREANAHGRKASLHETSLMRWRLEGGGAVARKVRDDPREMALYLKRRAFSRFRLSSR